ncbi:MAG: alcohol dehydrogenase catalytic domain-containing protein [Microbacteriaceae bacterium]|nr:alcohol dehydrogenase catalytic domain-containing protein [Microbacteriaceae bacterium]
MKAWYFHGTGKPFERVDIDEPTASPGKVVIDVKAAGLCHSDVGILEDPKWMAFTKTPVVPGHETAGVISEVGEGVTEWKVGDKVAVWPMIGPFGYGVNGGWEERAEADPEQLVRIPDGLSFELAAAATDAGMTSSGAVFGKGRVQAGMKVGIIGYGGLGQVGARLAHLEGAEVYVAEIKEDVWDDAKKNGAVKVAKSITEFKDDQLDVIIDFAGFGTTTNEAVNTVKFQGRVVIVGMGRLEATLDTDVMILNQVEVVGSNGGSKDDIETVMKWMASGDLSPQITMIDFEEIADGVQMLHDGKVTGRLVAKVAE